MPAELCLHRSRNGTDLQSNDSRFEIRHHHAGLEPAQLAAIGGRGVAGCLLRKCCKFFASVQPINQGGRLFLGLDEDMRGIPFAGRFSVRESLVIGLLQGFVRNGTFQDVIDHSGSQKRAPLILKRDLDPAGGCFAHGLGQNGLLDQLIEDPVEQHIVRQRQILLWQGRARHDHLTKCNLGSVYGCDHAIGIRCVLCQHWTCGPDRENGR